MLLRESLGDVLRDERTRRGLTLRELSGRSRISLGYLSEIERGHKEASSELLASLCAALEVRLSEVLRTASQSAALEEQAREREVATIVPATPSTATASADVVASAA